MYAVLDIESTGGKYNEEGIMEIAIYRFDGQRIVEKFISLINPEREQNSEGWDLLLKGKPCVRWICRKNYCLMQSRIAWVNLSALWAFL